MSSGNLTAYSCNAVISLHSPIELAHGLHGMQTQSFNDCALPHSVSLTRGVASKLDICKSKS
jgi:hypothetical protein